MGRRERAQGNFLGVADCVCYLDCGSTVVSFCLVCQSTQTRQVSEITNIFHPDEYFSSIFSPR